MTVMDDTSFTTPRTLNWYDTVHNYVIVVWYVYEVVR